MSQKWENSKLEAESVPLDACCSQMGDRDVRVGELWSWVLAFWHDPLFYKILICMHENAREATESILGPRVDTRPSRERMWR